MWIELGGKPKWLPLNFGYHYVIRTGPFKAMPPPPPPPPTKKKKKATVRRSTDQISGVSHGLPYKMVAMVIAPHSRACQGLPTGVRLLLQNEEVKLVSQTLLLGIIIDDSLSWSPHVDSICKKVGRKIGALRRTYRQLTPMARRQYFVSVIQPDLEYAASATIPFMPTGQQDRLLVLWRKAVRCMAGVQPH